MCGELPQIGEENTLEERVVVIIIGDCIGTKDPLTEEDTLMEVGDPLIGGYPGGGPSDRDGGPPRGRYPN